LQGKVTPQEAQHLPGIYHDGYEALQALWSEEAEQAGLKENQQPAKKEATAKRLSTKGGPVAKGKEAAKAKDGGKAKDVGKANEAANSKDAAKAKEAAKGEEGKEKEATKAKDEGREKAAQGTVKQVKPCCFTDGKVGFIGSLNIDEAYIWTFQGINPW